VKDQVDPSMEEYSKDNPVPYVSKLMKLDTPFDYLPEEAREHLTNIDKYVSKTLDEKRMNRNLSSYEKVISELEYNMLEGEELSMSEKIERFGNFARNALKLDGVEDVKKDLIKRLMHMRRGREMDNLILREIGKKIF
jgi:hypothetical protein